MNSCGKTKWGALAGLLLALLGSRCVSATTNIDVLLVYDTTATAWVGLNGGIDVFSASAIGKMNQAMANSDVDCQFRLVHAGSVGYTHTDLSSDLSSLMSGSSGLETAQTWRVTFGADIIAMLVDTGSAYGHVGQGSLLTTDQGNPERVYSVSSIRSVEISHTLTHEVGHNLGCGHSKTQATQTGPNSSLNSYSAGWYFTGTNGVDYHTIMAYNNDGSNTYQSAPLFSSPLLSFCSTTAGHAADGDNARTIRETMAVVADYRNETSGPTNDNFLSAPILSGSSGTEVEDSYLASVEAGEPAHYGRGPYRSVWWQIDPANDCVLSLDTHGSSFDTVLAVYHGPLVYSLVEVASNDSDGSPGGTSGLSDLFLSRGTTYFIAVAGYDADDGGSITLNWSVSDAPAQAISGTIGTSGGYNVGGVQLTASNGGGSTTTDGNGAYSLSVPYGWKGTVTPSKSDWTFSPSSRTYSAPVEGAEDNQDFSAECDVTHALSGTIRGAAGVNPGCAIVADPGGFRAVTEGATGSYSLTVPSGWSGTLRAEKAGFAFTPVQRTLSGVGGASGGHDFTASVASPIAISGVVSGPGGMNPGVVVYASPGYQTTTDSGGSYSLPVPVGWSGAVWPYKAGYSFSPAIHNIANLQTSYVQNFSGSTASGWSSISSGLPTNIDVYTVRVHPNNINELWMCGGDWNGIGAGDVGLFKSTNSGGSWSRVTSGLTVPGYQNFGWDVAFRPGQPTTMFFCGSDGLYKSTNGGSSWFIPTTSGSVIAADRWQYNGIGISAADPNTMFLVEPQIGIHRSTDGGSTWQKVYPIHSYGWFLGASKIQVDAYDPRRVYMVDNGGMCVSTNSGASGSWRRIANVRDFAVDGARGLVWLTWHNGGRRVSYSTDGCSSWTDIDYYNPDELVWGSALRVAVDPLLGYLYIAMHSPSTISDVIRGVGSGSPETWTWEFDPFAQGWPHNFETTYFFDCLVSGSSRTLIGHAESASSPLVKRSLGSVVSVSGQISGATAANPGTWISADAGGGDCLSESDGTYTLYVPANWTGVLEPDKAGVTFSPGSRALSNVSSERTGVDFLASNAVLTVAGVIADVEGMPLAVTLETSAGTLGVWTNVHGEYAVSVPYGWTGTVRSSSPGIVFTPAIRAFTSLRMSAQNQDFIGVAQEIHLSGRIATIWSNGVSGCQVRTSDGLAEDSTDEEGRYSLSVPFGWTGSVRVSRTGYSIDPTERDVLNVTSDTVLPEFVADPVTVEIGGRMHDDRGGALSGAVVSASGEIADDVVTDGSGRYSLTLHYGWHGRVSVRLTGYVFSPSSRDYGELQDSRQSEDFLGLRIPFTVSGRIARRQGDGLADVLVKSPSGGAVATLTDGGFDLPVFYGWTGELVPELAGFAFEPSTYSCGIVTGDVSGVQFLALDMRDSDGDGSANDHEYLAGTDPTNASSCLRIEDYWVSIAGDTPVIRWQSVSGRHYRIEWTTNLLDGIYSVLMSNIVATPPENVATGSLGTAASPAFYRIGLEE